MGVGEGVVVVVTACVQCTAYLEASYRAGGSSVQAAAGGSFDPPPPPKEKVPGGLYLPSPPTMHR